MEEKKEIKELKKLIVVSFDVKGFANGLVDGVVKNALEKVVKDSSNTIDDALMPLLFPLLQAEAKKAIEKYLDLDTIFFPPTPPVE